MPKTRNILIFVAIVIVLIFGYFLFIKSPSSNQASLVSSTANTTASTSGSESGSVNPSGTSAVSENFLSTLLSINTIKLDTSIFSNPAFSSLRDSSITLIPDTTEGRPNPFAEFGNDGVSAPIPPSSNSTSSSVSSSSSPTTPSTPNTKTTGKTINQ